MLRFLKDNLFLYLVKSLFDRCFWFGTVCVLIYLLCRYTNLLFYSKCFHNIVYESTLNYLEQEFENINCGVETIMTSSKADYKLYVF